MSVERPTIQRHGTASVSWGPKPYGGPKILANAPLSLAGFDDLIAALTQARAEYERTR